jgi:pseudaminic acid synthase
MLSDNLNILNNNKTFIVAELSANHNQDFEIAKKTIEEAKIAGADAIKLQTYTPDTLTIECDNEYFQIKSGTLWDGKTYYELYKEAYTPWEWQPKLKEYAERIGLICFSSPFDKSAVDFLEEMNVPAYKIASFEITDIPLIEYVASKGKTTIISTGIAEAEDIELAIKTCRNTGNNDIILLKCTSSYPAPLDEANLLTIPDMKQRYGVEVGLSDHTMGFTAALTAVALGAKMIEKHFIIDRGIGGPDASFSMQPGEFRQMVDLIREVENILGKATYELTDKMKKNRVFSRSLFVVKDINAGERITEENVRSIRPGHGLHPKYLKEIIGKKAIKNIKKGIPFDWKMVE